MRFVRNSYAHNVIPEPTDSQGILEFLEKIGRLCYRSDDLIKDDSAADFIRRLKSRQHWAMLEHYVFVIEIPKRIYEEITNPIFFENTESQDYAQKFKFVNVTPSGKYTDIHSTYYISGSATAFNYLWDCKCVKNGWNKSMDEICRFLAYHHPVLMVDPFNRDIDPRMKPSDVYDTEIRFLSREEINELPPELRKVHDWMSVHFVVERSSTHDLVRHRPLVSYAQESTRYCNYDKKGLCFVIPCQFDESDKRILEDQKQVDYIIDKMEDPRFMAKNHDDIDLSDIATYWLWHLVNASEGYKALINIYDESPQEAKSVLPHCLRAEINITTRMGEWYHIFKMRASKAAYPQIQEVMVPLLNETIKTEDTIFDDLEYLVKEGEQWIH